MAAGGVSTWFARGCGTREGLIYQALDRFVPVGLVSLSERVFHAPVRPDLVHQVVTWQLSRRRQGTHKVKNRVEVSGGGKKPWPQKGQGRARASSIRAPQFRGGGVVHGPTPRSYDYPLPNNVKRNALRAMLSAKFSEGHLWLAQSGEIQLPKTKVVDRAVRGLGWRSVLIVDHEPSGPGRVTETLARASFNLRHVLVMNVEGINVYDMLRFEELLITQSALESLESRFERYTSLD
uniref:Large ribosomal subunit protein uL4m n=1 Tax=Compsopogon caeruleus TaxID=31354 RepID=A0A7S1XEM5_9RHOD|mmetsp:Transcript_397/g.667  ORF Transcript_397/g.667 Transcript_397/m.667 type:complete len:236 (+) Transcript_397:288-995(+)|eukprot:CAMPEP_0184680784 /NCGR_PEP_ID=MMETSP0312-20130426/3700_1 /TAXON_ID=31354 /ORGANISM="Compsopogon coeruleus, Strain SAG 36.94" /LENGTH=235 /DNA_ID=CAMNT_0027131145 /DNA_START=162 /DNA_END=869 /DNA_ORIENTATION=+